MTVCIATVCRYIYEKREGQPDDAGHIVLTASDRMLTDEGLGIQYETGQGKWAKVATRVAILIADSIGVHADILRDLYVLLKDKQDVSPKYVADLYSDLINERRAQDAERVFLSPLKMTMKDFIKNNKALDPAIAQDLYKDISDYEVKVEAIVCGLDKDGIAALYSVNKKGVILNHTDIGFVAIGIGAVHAVPYLMAHGFWNGWPYYDALLMTYAAKKQAEIAPGVGKATDMLFISRDNVFTLYDGLAQSLEKLYPRHQKRIRNAERTARNQLITLEQEYVAKHPPKPQIPATSPQDESKEASSAKGHT